MKLFDNILKININTNLEVPKLPKYTEGDDKQNDKEVAELVKREIFYENYNEKSRDYCPYCKLETTFTHHVEWSPWNSGMRSKTTPLTMRKQDDKTFILGSATCSMNSKHVIYYAYELKKNGDVFKFAEYPFDLVKMKIPMPKGKLLKKLKLDKLLINAYNAAQNNLWLGAFIYARRVLEGVVDDLFEQTDSKESGWKTKMLGEKIKVIKASLPKWVRENINKLSKVLGDTIHNLEDDEAKARYQTIIDIIKLCIQKIESELEEKELEKALSLELERLIP